MNEPFENPMNLYNRLEILRTEHQELDNFINNLCLLHKEDELTLRRLKKRKLIIKEKIALIERMITPTTLA